MSGRITSEGVRSSVAIVLAYGGGAWLGGNGWIPLNHLQVIEDAAIAEIARVRLRQWVHYGACENTAQPRLYW